LLPAAGRSLKSAIARSDIEIIEYQIKVMDVILSKSITTVAGVTALMSFHQVILSGKLDCRVRGHYVVAV
jgi:hypothetical protein